MRARMMDCLRCCWLSRMWTRLSGCCVMSSHSFSCRGSVLSRISLGTMILPRSWRKAARHRSPSRFFCNPSRLRDSAQATCADLRVVLDGTVDIFSYTEIRPVGSGCRGRDIMQFAFRGRRIDLHHGQISFTELLLQGL